MPDLLHHAFRYWILVIVSSYASALHSYTAPSPAALKVPTHGAAEGPGPPSASTAGEIGRPSSATVWQAWVLPALHAAHVSLLTPAGHGLAHRVSEADESVGATVQLVLWACLAAIISTVFIFVVVMAWMYCGYSSSRTSGTSESLKGFLVPRSAGRSSLTSQQSGVTEVQWVDTALCPYGMLDSPRTTATSIIQGQLPGLPLCPLLVVPDGTRLGCVVQNDVCRMKQELSFDVSAVPGRGGAPLFRARVSELSTEGPAIYVETLGGRDQLAFLSTEDLWRGAASPVLGISRPWGLPYGTMQKGENGEYVVVRGQSPLLTFSGDYLSHSIQVMVPSGHTIATTLQTSPEEYQVHMQARTDAGLVILGLLAIDKCEVAARTAGPAARG